MTPEAKATRREWYAALSAERKAELSQKAVARTRARYQKIKAQVFDILGRVCVGCGEDDPVVLTVDHIAGRKGQFRKDNFTADKTHYYYQQVVDEGEASKSWARTLCHNCQFRAKRGVLQAPTEERIFPE